MLQKIHDDSVIVLESQWRQQVLLTDYIQVRITAAYERSLAISQYHNDMIHGFICASEEEEG